MRSRLATVMALALGALSCAPQQPASAAAANTSSLREVYCGEDLCPEILQDGACQFIARWLSIPGQFTDVRLSNPVLGENVVTAGADTYTVMLYEPGYRFDWTATRPVDFVAATTGYDSNVYVYVPPATSGDSLTGWSLMRVGQVLFCLNATTPNLSLQTTANAGFTRTWGWHIAKASETSTVTAAVGAPVDVAYAVTVSASALDSDYVASGTIAIRNTGGGDATDVTIAASLDGAPLAPACGSFAGRIPAGTTLTCTWTAAPGAALDAVTVVTVSSGGVDLGASATARFGAPTTIVDPCVVVTDDRAGALGTVCAAAAPASFSYTLPIGPYATCEASAEGYAFPNTASFSAPSGASGASTWTVKVRVPCTSAGCTLTQGYWKTHSKEGPAPYDARWKNVGPREEDTTFFLSGKTWIQVFRTPVRGSAYYGLAHQYLAAKLNVLAGASADAVAGPLAAAEAFLATATPATALTGTQRDEIVVLAAILDQFNSGKIGPGHCDDREDDGGCKHGDDEDEDEDGGGGSCHDRCREPKGHDHEEHEKCRERHDRHHDDGEDHDDREGHDDAEGHEDGDRSFAPPAAGGVHLLCVTPPPPPPKDDEDEADCRRHEDEDRRWFEGCQHEHRDHDGHHGCRDAREHRDCRAHEATDRKYGCGDRARHQECREHEERDARRD